LIALLAAPFSAALVAIGITRVLVMVVPATLLICLGLSWAIERLRRRVAYAPLAAACASLLVLLSFGMMRTALVDGPTWFTDYGLGGMQYGAGQLFSAIPEELAASPDTRILLSPNWANNPNEFLFFFLSEEQRRRVEMINVDSFLFSKRDLAPNQLFVMTPDDYQRAVASRKFVLAPPERTLPYPNGDTGFYFMRLQYVDDVDQIFDAERKARQQLIEQNVTVDGQPAVVRYSQLDIGEIANIFDGDETTLMRGLEANPFVIELDFASPRSISSLGLTVASMDFSLRVVAIPARGGVPLNAEMTYRNLPPDPHVDLAMPGGAQEISKLRIEITNLNETNVAHIHVRELSFR
jgi:hypothetical protein